MSEYFYNGRKLTQIPDEWTDELKGANKALLVSQGFKPVAGMMDDESSGLPFVVYLRKFNLAEDGNSYEAVYTERPLPVRLSQDKLINHELIAAKLETLMASLQGDKELQKWWCTSMVYLRGSSVAKKAMAAFGLDQETIEQIAIACRDFG